jgi:hypothetical protein
MAGTGHHRVMNTSRTTLLTCAAVAALTLPAAGIAHAAVAVAPAASTVTIKAEGTDLSGTVKSARAVCKDGRKVIVFKQKGARGGGDDKKFATDTAESDGSWNTGNTGTEGKFYAKVRATTQCKGDTSPTIRATR